MDIIKSDIVSLHGGVLSMQGGRQENQDDYGFLDTPLGFLLVVCDGMGGGPGGKTASYIAKYEISKTLLDCTPQTQREHALKMAVARAHEVMEARMEENPSLSGMGSTFVAVLINKQSAIVAHAGDSRCYKLRGKQCLYRSNDHSLVSELVRKKVMTEEEARLSPQSNVITRGLGSTKNQVPEIEEIPYNKGDRFVLCTDGVWGIMPHSDLIERLTAKSDIQAIVSNTATSIDKIGFLNGGHHDNHTLAMFEMETSSVLRPKCNWKRLGLWGAVACVAVCVLALCIWVIVQFTGKDKNEITLDMQPAPMPVTSIESGNTQGSSISSSVLDEQSQGKGVESVSGDSGQTVVENKKIDDNALLDALRNGKKKADTASTASPVPATAEKEKTSAVTTPEELVQKVINRYNKAKEIAEPSVDEANKKAVSIRQEIKSLMKELAEQIQDSEVRSTVEKIGWVVDEPKNWYVDAEPNKATQKYGLTAPAKNIIDKQIERLSNLKKRIQQK